MKSRIKPSFNGTTIHLTKPLKSNSRVIGCGQAHIKKQRGVVLFFALMALLVMSLAAVALIRSVDTSTMIAGNLSYKQSTVLSGDAGAEAAIVKLQGIEAANAAKNVLIDATHTFNQTNLALNPGYHSSADPALDLTANATWDGANNVVLPTDGSGNNVSYIIQRMCRIPNVAVVAADCLFSSAVEDKNGQNVPLPQDICIGVGCPAAGQTPMLRVTARVTGPRFSVSYVQAFVY